MHPTYKFDSWIIPTLYLTDSIYIIEPQNAIAERNTGRPSVFAVGENPNR